MEIKLRKGVHVKSKAAVIYSELERVRELGDGDISLQTLVDESKPKDAALHVEFDWHGATAANKWRLIQGRKLVQSIQIIHVDSAPTRVYESVRVVEVEQGKSAKPKRVFRTVQDIMSDPVTRGELLAQAFREGAAFRRRFRGLQELAKVFAALDEVLLEVELKKA